MMLIDLFSCSGCHACSVACKAEHRSPIGQFKTRVQTVQSGQFPSVRKHFVPTLCQHCEDAPCLEACPVGAIERTDLGIVQIASNRCVGSGDCVPACPYGAIFISDEDGEAKKCDFCSDRLAENLEPACVATCPTDALKFGLADREDIAEILDRDLFSAQWEPEATRPRIWYHKLDKKTAEVLQRINRDSDEVKEN
ncbi:hypothetical protein ATW55_03315 [Ferroacidibacillus organovorans]|uniref:4Fe-4S ferredoxin-type domain-containing protein n=1 Tax=Ferroacidibacillus organovorans TaxID=1765683 RepID=A0A101XRK6_9BACL|nr:hypothetical protein ATW55_03315 [Ferroacidibacillus organovorans]